MALLRLKNKILTFSSRDLSNVNEGEVVRESQTVNRNITKMKEKEE
jgi:hypothetical protein